MILAFFAAFSALGNEQNRAANSRGEIVLRRAWQTPRSSFIFALHKR
jgi:hypothetical protein